MAAQEEILVDRGITARSGITADRITLTGQTQQQLENGMEALGERLIRTAQRSRMRRWKREQAA